jgi:hypothetical protein
MKLHSRHHTLLGLALLLACVIGCKYSTSSTSSSNSSNDEKKTTNSSATNTSTAPDTPPEIAGKYSIAGTNPDGGGYKGDLEVIRHGDVYQFRWSAGNQSDGVGIINGGVVAVAFASGANGKGCGVVDYAIKSDGTLDGKWGYWGTDESGTEQASRTGGSGLVGDYDATGKNPNGKEYKEKLTVESAAGNLYKFSWSNNTEGLGIKRGDNVAVGIGGARCGFVAYEISNGTLDGIWGGYGSEKTGTEKATKQ